MNRYREGEGASIRDPNAAASIAGATLLAVLVFTATAFAQPPQRDLKFEAASPRKALIVGNQAYPKWPLNNPKNDARAMGDSLGKLGFETKVVVDANLRQLEQSIDGFIAQIRPGDVALFFYAGHGIQLAGENYLIPIDFDAKDEADAKYVSYSASRIQERMDQAGARLAILVLDACRNNPFRTTRGAGGGLAAMGTGKGTLIAFATAPGRTADDNPGGKNGLFTSHLIKALSEPGLSLDQVFNRVRERVYADSKQAQLPWTVSSVIGEFYFSGNGARPAQSAQVPETTRPEAVNPLARTSGGPVSALIRSEPEPPARIPAPSQRDMSAELGQANSAYERGDFVEAGRLANDVLRHDPSNRDGLIALSKVQWRTQQYALFDATARQALRAGAEFPFLVGHHHTLTGAHPVTLKIGQGKISFDPMPQGGPCNTKPFETALTNLVDAKAMRDAQGLNYLNVRIRDERNKIQTYNFVDPDSTVDKTSGFPKIVSPPKSAQTMAAIANAIHAAAGR
ncbi:MAG: caspase family protein [Bryobacteraceae bacterium]